MFTKLILPKLQVVSKFENSSDHGQMVALIVMTHEDERWNLSEADTDTDMGGDHHDDNACTVQDIIDALCVEALSDILKVLDEAFVTLS